MKNLKNNRNEQIEILRPNENPPIIDIDEEEASQVKGIEQIFKNIIEENSPKYTHTHTSNTQSTKKKKDWKMKSL